MKIQEYFSIPSKERKQKRYLTILQVTMSFISGKLSFIKGIFIILLHKIFAIQNPQDLIAAKIDFQILLLVFLATILKSCYYFNYTYKQKSISQIQPSLGCKEIIIPTAIKCFLYLGLVKLGAVYINSLDGVSILILNMVFMEYFRIKVTRQNYNLFKSILKIVFLIAALILTTINPRFEQSLTTNLFLLTAGSLSMISFVDLNSKVFEIYKPSVQEFMAKQYITELIIYSIYLLISLLTNNNLGQALFILNKFPYVILFVCLAALSEYAILEFLNKKKFGQLIFSFFCGFFWAFIYFLAKERIFQQRYLYGIGFFSLAILILTGVFESQTLLRFVQFLLRTERQPKRFSVQ